MSPPTPYRPKYPQPFSLRQAIDLDVPILNDEIQRITRSIGKLIESNREIGRFVLDLEGEGEADEADEFRAVVRENEQTIAIQSDRIDLLRRALQEKIGMDLGNDHYLSTPLVLPASDPTLDPPPTSNATTTPTPNPDPEPLQSPTTTTPANDRPTNPPPDPHQAEEQGGMYL